MSTQDRNREIVALVEAGALRFTEIGKRYGISRERVRQIAAAQGVQWEPGHTRPYLRQETIQAAMTLIDRGMPIAHAAESVGNVKPARLFSALIRRGLHEPSPQAPEWTAKEDAFLRQHYKKVGWPASRIASHWGRNRNEVIGRARRLGLCRADHWDRAKERTAKTVSKIAALKTKGLSLSQVAARMNIPTGTVSAYWHRAKQERVAA